MHIKALSPYHQVQPKSAVIFHFNNIKQIATYAAAC